MGWRRCLPVTNKTGHPHQTQPLAWETEEPSYDFPLYPPPRPALPVLSELTCVCVCKHMCACVHAHVYPPHSGVRAREDALCPKDRGQQTKQQRDRWRHGARETRGNANGKRSWEEGDRAKGGRQRKTVDQGGHRGSRQRRRIPSAPFPHLSFPPPFQPSAPFETLGLLLTILLPFHATP